MASDNIPAADHDFHGWVGPFASYVNTNAAALGLAPTDVAPLTAAVATWNTTFPAHNTAQAAAQAATTNKVQAREAVENIARPLIQQLQASTKVTDAQRNAMKINVRSRTRTRASVPTTAPMATVDTSQRLRHIISYRDASAPGSRKKPVGVAYCEIWAKVGLPAPADISQLNYLGNATTSPQLEEFTGAQAGQVVTYWLRWVNSRSEKGPWSEPVTATIVS